MKNILIYDDNAADAQTLKEYIMNIEKYRKIQVNIITNEKEAENSVSSETMFLLQDIELNTSRNGINFAVLAKQQFPELKVIFVTAHNKYCSDMFAAKPCGFIQKPITFEKVRRTFELINEDTIQDDSITIQSTKYSMLKLKYSDISFIEGRAKHIIFYDSQFNVISETRGKVSDLADSLPEIFFRCHQSYIVNLNYVTSMERSDFVIKHNKHVPISQKYASQAKKEFVKNINILKGE